MRKFKKSARTVWTLELPLKINDIYLLLFIGLAYNEAYLLLRQLTKCIRLGYTELRWDLKVTEKYLPVGLGS